ncbi:Calcium-activated chloride channel regulator 4A [Holothuria leucospilota]|uniref:Calcium-activated chloride channel regulator 4A n=1 Tax=Holothuria leucospilota TaxID=206669 RepID=A0A9Q1BJI2_HOLLE|nr:Calcium-activated chloride channel regulator 4A [Holothuria leucospilota]
MFTNASSYLYNATKKRAFFKEVTILIPETWSDDPIYTSPKNATFSGADVIVAGYNPRFAQHGENSATPYTKHFEGCGKQAMYIHMTSYFLLQYRHLEQFYGDYGRVLVHEWGHYRWGLFNEYPDVVTDRRDAKYFYYSDSNRIWEPASCPSGWRLIPLKYTGRTGTPYRLCRGNEQVGYEFGCTTQPSRDQPLVAGSIMHSYLNYPQVVNFCDNWADDQSSYTTVRHLRNITNGVRAEATGKS